MTTSPRCCTLGRGIIQANPEIMDQVAKRFTINDDSASTSVTQRKISSKMIQTSIWRFITSDRQYLAAENSNSILLRLPYDIRKRIYEFTGLSDELYINLNYDYPSWLDEYATACNSRNELIPPHTREHEHRDQNRDRKQDEGKFTRMTTYFWIAEKPELAWNARMKKRIWNARSVFLDFWTALSHILMLNSTGSDPVPAKTTGMIATVILTIVCFLVNFLTFVE